jgi:uncharacterized protein (UPF0276 family)
MTESLKNVDPEQIDFLEVAPENWIGLGGRYGKSFREAAERFPVMTHGLSLSLGGPSPLDLDFLNRLKGFMKEHNIRAYSEHLSYCTDDGHLYDLMPIPFTEEAVRYVAQRIRQTQDVLEQKIAVENVSFYAAVGAEMSEKEFLLAVLDEADCDLLLDVNNIYVNSVNHKYDAQEFLAAMPAERIMYLHVAGHYNEADDLIVDTHGADVVDPVWKLLQQAYSQFGDVPTLLELDFNIPPMEELLVEVEQIRSYQQTWRQRNDRTVA